MGEIQKVSVEVREAIAIVTINRPKALNALDNEILDQLKKRLGELKVDSGIAAIVLTGAGDKAFVAGADIRQLHGLTPAEGKSVSRRGQSVMQTIEEFPKPVIAAVNGFCLGGGFEVALACHLRLAGTSAKFGLPEVKLGLIPGYGGTQRLSRLVGRGVALEMILTGEMISAEKAFETGIVNRLAEDDSLIDESLKLASKIVANSPAAVKCCLEAVNSGAQMPLAEGLDLESALFGLCFATEDAEEGISAFLEKRKPNFQGK
jgi:enoyl-CoA hydratase